MLLFYKKIVIFKHSNRPTLQTRTISLQTETTKHKRGQMRLRTISAPKISCEKAKN